MKTDMRKVLILCLGGILFPSIGSALSGDDSFQIQAPITVSQPGLVETILPPELHHYSPKGLDLRVLGPEGKSRACELYWRQEKQEEMEDLQEKSTRLLDKGHVQWIGGLGKPLRVSSVRIFLTDQSYVGKVDISVLKGNTWKTLVRQAGVFNSGNQTDQGAISIPDGIYKNFKLDFVSYDRNFRQKLITIDRVEVTGGNAGIDFVEKNLSLSPNRMDLPGETDLSAVLQGSGIYVKQLQLKTEAQFTGDWILEREEIGTGRKSWVTWKQGQVEEVGKGSDLLVIEVGEILKGKTLRLRLKSPHFLGRVKSLELVARYPRLVFRAEAQGTYMIQAGCGEGISVLEEPSASNRGTMEELHPGQATLNPQWKPESLVDKYHLEGGPFDSKGYSWEAPILVSTPGYYRLDLNQQASLDQSSGAQFDTQNSGFGNPTRGLRIVRHDVQIPYFITQGETREVTLSGVEDYDRAKNTSTWTLSLPQASSAWTYLILESRGIFERQVDVERKNPGTLGWEHFTTLQWNGPQDQLVRLEIPLNTLGDSDQVRVTIAHGDNHPIVISKIALYYQAPAICFLAESADGYVLMGGNPDAEEPHYDLSLIEESLLENEPQPVSMGDVRAFKGQGMRLRLFRSFETSHWGLYAVLILVTLGMILIVVRLFPAISDDGPKKRK